MGHSEELLVEAVKHGAYIAKCDGISATIDNAEEMEANAHTIALAGTTANKLDALGWDGDACIEALPEIVAALAKVYETRRQWREDDRYSSIDYMDAMDAVPMEGIFSKVRPAKGGER